MKIALLLLAVLVERSWNQNAATSPSSQPATTSEQIAATFQRDLDGIDAKAREINDLKADFRQLKHTALLKKPMESKGTVLIWTGQDKTIIRWDTTQPHPVTTWIGGDELRIHSQQESLLEIYPIEKGWSQLAASPLPRLESLREHFTISPWNWPGNESANAEALMGLKLAPKQEQIREHVSEVRILIDRETACVVAAEVLYPDHDRLEIRFDNIRTNRGIQEQQMELEIPEGTTISRPFEAEESSR